MGCEVLLKKRFNLFNANSTVVELCTKIGGISINNLLFTNVDTSVNFLIRKVDILTPIIKKYNSDETSCQFGPHLSLLDINISI